MSQSQSTSTSTTALILGIPDTDEALKVAADMENFYAMEQLFPRASLIQDLLEFTDIPRKSLDFLVSKSMNTNIEYCAEEGCYNRVIKRSNFCKNHW